MTLFDTLCFALPMLAIAFLAGVGVIIEMVGLRYGIME